MAGKTKNGPKRDHYAEVTDKIIAAMETGEVPWRKSYDGKGVFAAFRPRNPVSGTLFKGINLIQLATSPKFQLTADPRWVTFKQAVDNGWDVSGKGMPVFFFKPIAVKRASSSSDDEDLSDGYRDAIGASKEDNEDLVPLQRFIMRKYTVFHASQVGGIPAFNPEDYVSGPNWEPHDLAEHILLSSGAVFIDGYKSVYNYVLDKIQVPPKGTFDDISSYYKAAFHELIHWTGHPSRLDRNITGDKEAPEYAIEELRAELGAVFLAMETGLDLQLDSSAAYMSSWIEALKNDKKLIFKASADAQRITDYVLTLAGLSKELHFDGANILGPDETVAPVLAQQNEYASTARQSSGMRR